MQPKYPNVQIDLLDCDGNAFSIIALVSKAMRRAGIDKAEISAFQSEATSGSYDGVIQTAMRWVDTTMEFEDAEDYLVDDDEGSW